MSQGTTSVVPNRTCLERASAPERFMSKPSRPAAPQSVKADYRTFFVTGRTFEGKALLQTDRMADLFVDVLRDYMREGNFEVHDFVVMRNHVHLLLTTGGDMTIEKAMQLIKGNFSYRASKELGIRGEIWQRGFSQVRVRDEESFRTHQLYIYNNPVKAGMARVPEEYPHGSLYLRARKAQGLKP
jgi:putative transposase